MALKAGYVGVKKNDATKLSQLPGITEIGTGLELDDGELSATGATKTIEGNPEGSSTTDLTKLQIGTTIYGVSNVKANPSGTASSDLTKLTVDNTIYSIPGNDNSKCYQTDDDTESTIVDADYIPFLDSSAASGAGAPRKSTWSNFKAKLKAYFDDIYTLKAAYSKISVSGNGITINLFKKDNVLCVEFSGEATAAVANDEKIVDLPEGYTFALGTDHVFALYKNNISGGAIGIITIKADGIYANTPIAIGDKPRGSFTFAN